VAEQHMLELRKAEMASLGSHSACGVYLSLRVALVVHLGEIQGWYWRQHSIPCNMQRAMNITFIF